MSALTLIRGGLLVDWLPFSAEPSDLLVEDGHIAARGRDLSARGADVVDASGCVVMPGWVIAHHHLYSSLARGMPAPPEAPGDFLQILQRVWWVLDRCLDIEAVRMSALVGGVDALCAGATFIVDHHASPNAVIGSLGTLAEALESLGVRSCLAYEVSDRDGERARREGLVENRDFSGHDGWSWPLFGAHASFTLSDASLKACAEAGRVHVHLLEDPCDREVSIARYGADPLARFDAFGLVGPGSLFAHGVHLSDAELALVRDRGARLVTNPRSNANNGVGCRPIHQYAGIACLGTDGMDSDLWSELKFAYFRARDAGAGDAMTPLVDCLQNNYRLASDISGLALGSLSPEAVADLMIVEPRASTPLTPDNFLGHLVFGLCRHHVRDVMSAGVWRLRNRQLTVRDARDIFERARPVARSLWDRMKELWQAEGGGHPFPT